MATPSPAPAAAAISPLNAVPSPATFAPKSFTMPLALLSPEDRPLVPTTMLMPMLPINAIASFLSSHALIPLNFAAARPMGSTA